MIETIPLEVLMHTITYEEYQGSDWGEEFKAPVTIENVLVQPISNMNRTQLADSTGYQSIVFVDGKNSKPNNIKFVKGSKITFDGDTATLDEISPIYVFGNVIHHTELGLK